MTTAREYTPYAGSRGLRRTVDCVKLLQALFERRIARTFQKEKTAKERSLCALGSYVQQYRRPEDMVFKRWMQLIRGKRKHC